MCYLLNDQLCINMLIMFREDGFRLSFGFQTVLAHLGILR